MSQFVGMDVEAMERLANQMDTLADELDSCRGRSDQRILRLPDLWLGLRQVRFLGDWTGLFSPRMRRAAGRLRAAAAQIRREVAQQRAASAANSGDWVAALAQTARSGSSRGAPGVLEALSPRDRAGLAGGAYDDGAGLSLPPGWTRVDDAKLVELGLDPSLFSKGEGFSATLIQGPDGAYALAFRGTLERQDWLDNGINATGNLSPQHLQAIQLAHAVTKKLGSDNVEMVGHSLGGAHAALAALATGSHATTFNAAGPSQVAIVAALETHRTGKVPFWAPLAAQASVHLAIANVVPRIGAATLARQYFLGRILPTNVGDIDNYRASMDPVSGIANRVNNPALGKQHVIAFDPTPDNNSLVQQVRDMGESHNLKPLHDHLPTDHP